MRISIQARLTGNTLLVLLFAMALAGSLAWAAVERQYLDTQRENLSAQAALIAAALHGAQIETEAAQPYVQSANVLPGVHTRLLSEGGAVLLELPLSTSGAGLPLPLAEGGPPVPPEALLERTEIRAAMAGQATTAIRRVPAAGYRRVLYAAAPVYASGGSLSGIIYLATPLPAGGLPGDTALQLLAAVVLAVALAGLAGRLLARQIARPLQSLSGSANALAAGRLEHRARHASDIAELQELTDSFNSMAESLARADQAQKTFIADVSHELRTPLTVIKGTIETLEDGAVDDRRGRVALLDSMGRETDRLIRMVNELLVLVRADAGELRLRLQPVRLDALARARCAHMHGLAARAKVAFRVRDETGGSAVVLGDPDRLAQALDNLLDNALRHTATGSTVSVRIFPHRPGGYACSVTDKGAGIPAEHLPHVFERFYRVEGARERGRGGSGLGLAIAHAILRAHGGGLDAASPPGQGATFTIRLPASEAASEPTVD